MTKRVYSNPAEACVQMDDAFEAVDGFPVPPGSVRLHIGGLRQVGEGIFDLAGVKVREIDWELVAKAMGREFLPDALAREIDDACFRYDVAEILSERIARR